MINYLESFFDELDKIGAAIAHSISGGVSNIPPQPGEVRSPISPKNLKPKVARPKNMQSINTNYSRSNVEAPGTNVTVGLDVKETAPPPITY